VEINSELTVAEVTLRAAAVVALATVALVVAVGLPPVFAEDASLGVVSMGAMALSLWLGWMLAAARRRDGRSRARGLGGDPALPRAGRGRRAR